MLSYLKRGVVNVHSFFNSTETVLYRKDGNRPFFEVYCDVFICSTTWCYSLSLIVICCNSLSFVVTRCTTRCHSLSFVVPLIVIRCHSLSFVVTRCHSLYHSLPLVVIRCYSLSRDVPLVCLFINDPEKACHFTFSTETHSKNMTVLKKPEVKIKS